MTILICTEVGILICTEVGILMNTNVTLSLLHIINKLPTNLHKPSIHYQIMSVNVFLIGLFVSIISRYRHFFSEKTKNTVR
jgi:hypothetical protein